MHFFEIKQVFMKKKLRHAMKLQPKERSVIQSYKSTDKEENLWIQITCIG